MSLDAKSWLLVALGCISIFHFFTLGTAIMQKRRDAAAAGSSEAVAPTPVGVAIGFVTNFFDTLGIGSFAPTTSLFRFFKSVPDENIPGTLNVGLPSTTANVVFAQFEKSAQVSLFGVKYKTSGQAISDTLGGQISLVIDTVTAARPHIAGGKLRALGITSLKASEMLPGVKPVSEQGVQGFDVVAWDAIFAPHGTPAEIVSRLVKKTLNHTRIIYSRKALRCSAALT